MPFSETSFWHYKGFSRPILDTRPFETIYVSFYGTVKDSGRRELCETCEQLWDWMLVWLKALQAPFGLCSDVWLSQQLQDNNALWHCRNIPVSELMSSDKTHTKHTHMEKTHIMKDLCVNRRVQRMTCVLEILGWLPNELDDSGINVI